MDDESTSFEPKTPEPTITYEETPVITPIPEQPPDTTPIEQMPDMSQKTEPVSQESQLNTFSPAPKKRSAKSFIKGLLIFGVLFIVGYALSGVVQNLINSSSKKTTTKETIAPTPVPTVLPTDMEATESGIAVLTMPTVKITPMVQASPSAWKQYNPVHGTTRGAISTIQFSLPSTILAPICDGTSCGSQGTYLPGGTRLTIAPRGVGEVLPDYRGKIISDAAGKTLVTNETTIAGKKATEYTTDTTGSTAGGYAFTTMHGYMIEVTDTLSFEINHFSPSGVTADFAADDALFKSIVATIKFN